MIETTIKKRTVIQRKLVRVDASPERQVKFDTIERDFLTGLPIVGLAITFVAVLAVNVIFFGQPTTSGYREKRERAALDSSSALLAQMYETANDTARAKVAQLYQEETAALPSCPERPDTPTSTERWRRSSRRSSPHRRRLAGSSRH
mgnify:CR=1 FL=1